MSLAQRLGGLDTKAFSNLIDEQLMEFGLKFLKLLIAAIREPAADLGLQPDSSVG